MRPIDADKLDGHRMSIHPGEKVAPKVRQEMTGWNRCIEYIKSAAKTIEPEPSELLSMVKPETVVWRECKACGAEVEGPAYPFCPYCGKPMRNGVQKNDGNQKRKD